jgi:hypothetical protein
MIDFYIYLSVSIGCFVFLIQQTDFIYEYSSLFCNFLKIKTIPKWLNFHTYENSNSFENYISFLGSVYGAKKNILGFLCRLITCFICLNCFLCVFSVLLLTKNILMIFPCFFLSILTYYILFVIKKHIFS